MFGLELKFECKECGKEQEKHIGATPIYKINNNECDYIPVHCCHCKTLNYIAEGVSVIEEDTDKAKLKAFENVKNVIGNTERANEWFYANTIFLTKDKAVLLKKEVETIENVGVTMF